MRYVQWFLLLSVLAFGACKRGRHSVEVSTVLTVGAGSNNPADANISADQKGLVLLHILMQVEGQSPVYVSQITVHATGSADEATDVDTLYLYYDMDGSQDFDVASDYLIAAGAFNTDDGYVTFVLSQPVMVTESRPVVFFVVADLSGHAANGDTFSLRLNGAGDVLSSIGSAGGTRIFAQGLPLASATFTVTKGGAELNLLSGSSLPPSIETVRGHPRIAVMQFRLYARVDGVSLLSVRLHLNGPVTAVSAVSLWLDTDENGYINAQDVKIDDGRFNRFGEVLLSCGAFVLSRRVMRTFFVTFDVSLAASAGVSVSCYIDDFSDIETTASVVSGSVPCSGATVSIRDGGRLTITKGSAHPAMQVVARANQGGLVVAQLHLSADFEPINLRELTLSVASNGGNPDTDISKIAIWYDADGDGEATTADTELASGTTSGGTVTFSLPLPLQIGENSYADILILMDVARNAPREASYTASIQDISSISASGQYSLLAPEISATFPVNAQTLAVLFDHFLDVGRMGKARFQHTATPFLDPTDNRWKVLICGGFDGKSVLDDAEIYDPHTRAFTPLSTKMTTPRMNHTTILLPDGKVMLIGGFDGNFTTNSIEVFDPATRTFSAYNILMRHRRENLTAFRFGSDIYIFCGFAYYQPSLFFATTVEHIDYQNGFLTLYGNVSYYRMLYGSCATQNGLVVVSGGLGYQVGQSQSPYPLKTVEVWQIGGSLGHRILQVGLPAARVGGAAVPLPSGNVLILGGYSQNPAVVQPYYQGRKDCELLVDNLVDVVGDETLYTSGVGSLSEVRYLPVVAVLGDGRVLVAGGASSDKRPLSSAEIYDPQSKSFAASQGTLNTPRYGAAFCTLPGPDGVYNTSDDEVFVCGGLTGWVTPLYWPLPSEITASAEVYLP